MDQIVDHNATSNLPPALKINGLTHNYKGHLALDNVSFEVPSGCIHGFVGPNGAGKTTTLKVVATLMKPQTGRVEVKGFNVVKQVKEVRGMLGFMPDHFSMYPQMTVLEYLDFFAAAYGIKSKDREKITGDVLQLTDMDGRQHSLIKGLSRGMQQRVSLARVLVNDPQLLLLDEPASGLDPRARIELMDILRELARMGKTIFISSHILSELADLCDSVTIIDRGRIKYSGQMESLLKHEGETKTYVIDLQGEVEAALSSLRSMIGVESLEYDELQKAHIIVFCPTQLDSSTLLRSMLDAGAEVHGFREDRRHLNQVFMDLTEPGVR